MSCEAGSRATGWAGRIGAGIEQLSNRRGFYAGLTLLTAGLVASGLELAVGAGLLAAARRGSDPAQSRPPPRELGGGKKEPVSAAAGSSGKKRTPVDFGRDSSSRSSDLLSPKRRVDVRLVRSRVGLYAGQDEQGPVIYAVENGYVVLRPDGTDTGLAVTPLLKMENGRPVEDDSGWSITHIPSGKSIPGAGPYGRREEARLLAGLLAQLDWSRDETELSGADIRRTAATVSAYNAALTEQNGQSVQPAQPVRPSIRRAATNEPLRGQLVADGYGGLARVLDDSGERLLVVDSLGERYEVSRNQVRPPDEADFEGVRVARAFDPASRPEAECARCGQSGGSGEAGERWHRMNRRDFCPRCATAYAAEEAYIKEEEVGNELPP